MLRFIGACQCDVDQCQKTTVHETKYLSSNYLPLAPSVVHKFNKRVILLDLPSEYTTDGANGNWLLFSSLFSCFWLMKPASFIPITVAEPDICFSALKKGEISFKKFD